MKHYYHLLKTFESERIKWVDPTNMHITLKFFGETNETRIHEIVQAVQNISNVTATFQLSVNNIGIFGSSYKPRVIWCEIEDNGDIKDLASGLSGEFEKIGFPDDRQNFVPHLTLGRIKELKHKRSFQTRIDQFKALYFQQFVVNELFLFESVLSKTGPVYVVKERFPLV